ncbi:hypothetical protein BBJ28_00001749 [Nothophytophthora sp. Chile5]|nr:hypothetical protein BBJ28_00001749 [Nothophytophthora sp. Chile5]
MAAGLPDDLVLEYDMLHLADVDDSGSGLLDAHFPVPASPSASLNVEDLLANCSVGVGITTQAPSASTSAAAAGGASCASSAAHTGGAGCASSTSRESPTASDGDAQGQDEFADFILDGEQFLRDMEKVVKLDLDSETDGCLTAEKASLEECAGAIDLDAFTDIDMMSSPCPSSTYASTFNGSPCKTDCDEFEVECPLLMEQQKQQQQDWLATHFPAPMSPPKLPHTHSSLSTSSSMSGQSSWGHTDSSVSSSSPLPATPEVEAVESHVEAEQTHEPMEEETLEMELLEKEAKYLDAQRDFLVSRAKSSRPQRTSIKAKRRGREAPEQPKLLKSEQDNKLLSELVTQQKVYTDNFKAMLAFAPVNDVRMALMTPMESYIRLGKDFDERRKVILSLREEKLDMTYKYIEQKAQGLNFDQPYQYSDMFEKFGKHYCVNFAISKYDGVSVFQVGRAIYEQIAGKDEALNNAMGNTTIREVQNAEKMPDMESNAIFYCRFGDNSAVLATDYIDQDDLHPYDSSNRIRKDVSSGVVLSGHEDAKGNKYVVMKRYLMAKYHMYPHKVSQEQRDRFFASMPKCHDTMKELIVDRLERNEGGCPCTGGD